MLYNLVVNITAVCLYVIKGDPETMLRSQRGTRSAGGDGGEDGLSGHRIGGLESSFCHWVAGQRLA